MKPGRWLLKISMKIIDANIILRYLLKDNLELHKKSVPLIETNRVFVPNEIAAELVYVLEKVYSIPKKEIRDVLAVLFARGNFNFIDKDVILSSLEYYSGYNLDYADALLVSYKKIQKAEVLTFDRKLLKIIEDI